MPTLPDVASATLLLNLQADALVLNDGDPVSTWADLSGNGHDFTQSGIARPIYHVADGVPFVYFDGDDDYLVGPDIADDLSSFAVVAAFVQTDVLNPPSANGGGAAFISKMDDYGAGAGWFASTPGAFVTIYTQEDGGAVYAEFDTNTYDQASLDLSFVCTAEYISRNTLNMYVSGTQVTGDLYDGGAPVTSMANSAPLRIGLRVPGSYMKMPLAALMLYAPAPSSSDRQAIDTWVRGKCRIPTVLFQTNLVAYWLLDEASSSRTDATGNGNTLTEVHGLVGSTTGVNGDGALFLTADGDYLQAASTADLVPSTTSPYTITVRVKLQSNTDQTLISKGASGVYDYHVYWSAAGVFGFTYGSITVTVPTTYSASDFFFLEASAGSDLITLRVNGTSGSDFVTAFDGSAGALSVGGDATNDPGTPAVADAIIDDVGIWRRLLTADERALLIAGATWPFTTDLEFFRAATDAGDITGTLAYDTVSNVVASCTLDNTFGASDLGANLYKTEGDDLILWQSVVALSGASVTRTIAAGLTVGEVDGVIDVSGGTTATQVAF